MTTAAEIRKHYDSLALVYRAFWGDHLHHGLFAADCESPHDAQSKMLEHCVGLLNPRGGEEVLDVGCGFGATLLYLAEQFNMRGIGLTISSKQAQVAAAQATKAGLSDQLRFIVADAERFQFPAARFDLVWVMESSEHFSDKSKYFQNADATLHRGGRLLLAAWTGAMHRQRVRAVAQAFLCPQLWTADQYCSAIESAGMKVEVCEDLTARVVRTWKICEERVNAVDGVIKLLPRSVQEFVGGIETILDAYNSGDLTYTTLVARK